MPLALLRLGSGVKKGGAGWLLLLCWGDVGVVWLSSSRLALLALFTCQSKCTSHCHTCHTILLRYTACYYDSGYSSATEIRGYYLLGVTWFRYCSRDWLLLFDWRRGLEAGHGAKTSPCRGYQRRPQRGLTVGTWMTVWNTDINLNEQIWCNRRSASCTPVTGHKHPLFKRILEWVKSDLLWLERKCPDWPDQWLADPRLLWTAFPNW